MAVHIDIPGASSLRIEHLLLDVNGTLTDRGALLPGVAERIITLRTRICVRLLTADTYGTLAEVRDALGGVAAYRVDCGAQKAAIARELGADTCAAIGNGANDAPMLAAVGLGIAVIGPEGASVHALRAADLVCPSIHAALDLLADPRGLIATLRP